MDAEAIDRAAAILRDCRLGRRPLDALPEACRPADTAAAYAVQRALHDKLSEAGVGRRAGHKIGCTTAVMQRFLSIDQPAAGAVFQSMARLGKGTFADASHQRLGVECEIAVRLDGDLPGVAGGYDRETVAGAVGACMAAIELVEDRYRDYRQLPAPTLIADDFFQAGAVLGAPVTDWRRLDLATIGGRMTINGAEVGRGIGGDVMGHPFSALAWLANLRAGTDEVLRAGDFVLLGSVVETHWVAAGDVIDSNLEGLGTARAVIT